MTDWRYRIYEFVEADGHSAIGNWLERERITSRDRGQLRQKMDMLAMHGTDLMSGLVAGPIKSDRYPNRKSHTYKLVIHASMMLRPMFCKGPSDNENEFTFLCGGLEIGDVLYPDSIEAEQRRSELIADPSRRVLNGRYK